MKQSLTQYREETKLLILKEVEKSFGEKKIIDQLSFYIKQGECAGLVGLNGAGKTTVIRMLTGSLLPDKGVVRVHDLEPYFRQTELIPFIGMVSATCSQLWKDMPLRFSMENCRKMYSIAKEEYESRIEELHTCMELKSFWEQKVSQLSLGQKMLGELAYTLLFSPSVLFLDEPTIGLAVDVKQKVMRYLKRLNQEQGVTILYTGHNMREMEFLCNHLILLHRGKKLYDGSVERLQLAYGTGESMELLLEEGQFPDLEDLPLEKYRYEDRRLVLYYRKSIISNTLILEHITKQCRIMKVQMLEPSLEEIIREIMK